MLLVCCIKTIYFTPFYRVILFRFRIVNVICYRFKEEFITCAVKLCIKLECYSVIGNLLKLEGEFNNKDKYFDGLGYFNV